MWRAISDTIDRDIARQGNRENIQNERKLVCVAHITVIKFSKDIVQVNFSLIL